MKTTAKTGSTVKPPSDMLGYELRRASVAVATALSNEVEPLGLRVSEATLLSIIGENPGCTQSEVGRALGAQPANLVPLVSRLVTSGLVARRQAEGRAIALSLTESGVLLLAEVNAAFARHEARITRRMPAAMRAQTIAALRQICKDACCDD